MIIGLPVTKKSKWMTKYFVEKNYKRFFYYHAFKNISALKVSRDRFFQQLQCYNERGEATIRLEKIITEGDYVKLFQGNFLKERF